MGTSAVCLELSLGVSSAQDAGSEVGTANPGRPAVQPDRVMG